MMVLSPLTSTLAFALFGQLVPASIFVPLQTEKYYDACGALGFLSTTALSLYWTPSLLSLDGQTSTAAGLVPPLLKSGLSSLLLRVQGSDSGGDASTSTALLFDRHPRQWIASACVALWAVRIGTFLFARVRKSGGDPRFDSIKTNAWKFTFAWAMQAVWVGLTALPVFMINALPARLHAPLGIWDVLALGVWTAGLTLEVVADRTKSQWRAEKEAGQHKETFLTRGVWSWSRHPNYFGEVVLWSGLALLATSALAASPQASTACFGSSYAIYAPFISPVFEYTLIRYLSGVPMLEQSMDAKLKGDARYERYKASVPCFTPLIGSKT